MRIRSILAATALTSTLLLVGCGGSSSDGDKPSSGDVTTTSTAKTATTAEPADPVETTSVDIAEFAFSPQVITVKAGSTVTWTNKDSTTHTVTSDDGDFDAGSIPAGEQKGVVMKDAGTFTYHCEIHTAMTGTIIVTK